MDIVFFGSDDFALKHLETLLSSSHHVVACVTQPDRKKGRGMKLVASPIKECALQNNISLLQPESIKNEDTINQLKEFDADLFVVVAYGQILTQEILDLPKIMSINVHGSLLPKYRGAAPINWAVINGEDKTGVTVQKMVKKLDAGDIISQAEIAIGSDMDAAQLRLDMMELGANLLVETINNIEADNYQLIPQDESLASYASKLDKNLGKVDWNEPAHIIYNKIRGLKPWPGSFTFFNGKRIKVLGAKLLEENFPGKVSQVVGLNSGIEIACHSGGISLKNVHPESSNPIKYDVFINKFGVNVGDKFD